MKIWVDADACPKVIKEILFRAAERTGIPVVLVANMAFHLQPSPLISMIQVPEGPDVADDRIVDNCAAGDLVITADVPLAARVLEKSAQALDPRGRLYDKNNIGQILSMRDFMDSLRGSGIETGGPAGFGAKQRQEFSNQLDKILARARKQ